MTDKYTIDIEDGLWEDFKKTVNKGETINDVLVQMIERRVQNR